MDSASILDIEAVGSAPFVVIHRDERYALVDPCALTVDAILIAIGTERAPGLPGDMPVWKMAAATSAWVAHHDLPSLPHTQRLIYLIDRYRNEIEYDLQAHLGLDLGTMFRARQWRRLLNMIDHLPRNSWYTETMSNDEEHAKLLSEAMAKRNSSEEGEAARGTGHPPMRVWTQESSMLAEILDGIRNLTYTLRAVNGDKTAKPPVPTPRPITALEVQARRARHNERQRRHETLVGRLLPHKAKPRD